MTPLEEESFPRGGRKVSGPRKRPVQTESFLFDTQKSVKAKKAKKTKRKEPEQFAEDVFQHLNIQGTLTYQKLQDGMVILGCVRHITNYALEVELPGLTFATIRATDISDPFTKHLNNLLETNDDESDTILRTLFQVGQFLPVKILSIESTEKRTHVAASTNPRDINSERNHNSFKKGMLMWGCIKSIADHGYEISNGVKNCRIFLPSKNVDENKIYSVGEPLWCTIHKSETLNSSTTLRVSAKAEHIKGTIVDELDSLHDVIPGMQVKLLTEKITKHGIQGTFLEDYFGYIDESYLKHPFKKLSEYNEGKLITAYVLYIEPATKITHLTLHNLEVVPAAEYKVGEIVSSEVFAKTRKGLFLKLPNKEKGFVTNKRIINSLPKNKNSDITEVIQKKFLPGSKHSCRILDYNRMSKVYICTVEQQLIKERTFSTQDVKIGQLLNVDVEKVNPEGLIVSAGHIRGFVPNLHISNLEYSDNIKKKFKEGVKVNARVLNIENGNVLFTLKPNLVESEACLSDTKDASPGEQYPGIVVSLKPTGVLVAFYGSVKGWLSRREIDDSNSTKWDLTKYFYRGQVINVKILRIEEDKIQLTLKDDLGIREAITYNIKIGEKVVGVVTKISDNDIGVSLENTKYKGIVPVAQLSSSSSLCHVIKNTYKIGDKIEPLICLSNKYPLLLSRREAMSLDVYNYKIKRFEALHKGNILRCLYESKCDSGIYVRPLISNCNENILIKNKDMVKENPPKYEQYQSIVAKVLKVDPKEKQLRLTVKLENVFVKSVESAVRLLSQHLTDIKYLQQCGSQNNWEICQYQPGERVNCKIESVSDQGGCVVVLPNGVKGLAVPYLCPKDIKEGKTIEGVFLSQNFKDGYAEMCLRKDVSSRINKIQDGVLDTKSLSSCVVEKLLVKNDYIIGVLKQKECNRQLIYLPLYLHENDFTGCQSYYAENKFKTCVCGKIGTYLIGMSKKLFLKLDKEVNKNNKFKKSRTETSSVVSKDDSDTKELKNNGSLVNKIITKKHKEDKQVDEEEKEEASSTESDDDISEAENLVEQKKNSLKEKTILGKRQNTTRDNKLQVERHDDSENNKNKLILPGISSFFDSGSQKIEEESSSDDEELEPATKKKKKKLTPSERAEQLRLEEEHISKIEKELADSTKAPESADQFDRLLLANPNSSELWTKYISFHVAATEIDKARTAAKRALETIDMTLVDEKLNVWVVLLNLENMFGSKESFENVLEDALRYNDSLQIYLRIIQMLADAGKFNEMEEKIKKVRGKHKKEPKMWLELGKIYYQTSKFKEARNIKEAALKSIMDKKTQFNIIVRFAIMEFKYGEEDHGSAIFETILSNDPRKVNIWTTYVDQLVKKGKIEQARRILEKSVCQKLPLKSMKALFLKFRRFEEEHGTEDSVQAVKRRAQEYVATVSKS